MRGVALREERVGGVAPACGGSCGHDDLREKHVGDVTPTYGQPAWMPFTVAVAIDVDLDLRGPSVAAEPADKTRRAPHRDVRRFPRGQDARSENPAGSANPTRSVGREGGVCFLCARFLCTSKERWLAPSRRESS